ncbi:hypothetical protein [Pseudomonas sp.]|uniref:hypothetical protein n=1 Tax=Pseudomonas sp. TaxID=306 RepID=UPI003C71D0CE
MIKIFEDDESTLEMLEHVLEQGIAGISGGRLETRIRLAEVQDLAERRGHKEIVALATVNHFWGELAFIFDQDIYRFDNAKQAVVDAYNKLLAERGIFPT